MWRCRHCAKVGVMHHDSPIIIAVDDPNVHSEAIHLAAATGRPLVDASSSPALVERHFSTAHALLVDASAGARALTRAGTRPGVFLVGADPAGMGDTAAQFPGVDGSYVLPAEAADLLRALGSLRALPEGSHRQGRVIAVVGAAGGVGASTLGASISRAAAAGSDRDAAPTLVDAHRYSGGLDLLIGIEEEIGARWGEIALGEGSVERADLRRALPSTGDGIAVLTCSRTTVSDPFRLDRDTLERTVAALATSGVTVVDCPAQLVPQRCDLAVLVTPGEVRAAAASARIAAELAAQSVTCAIALRRRSWSGLASDEIERVTKVGIIAEVPEIRGLTRKVETSGLPQRLPRALVRAAQRVLDEVGA